MKLNARNKNVKRQHARLSEKSVMCSLLSKIFRSHLDVNSPFWFLPFFFNMSYESLSSHQTIIRWMVIKIYNSNNNITLVSRTSVERFLTLYTHAHVRAFSTLGRWQISLVPALKKHPLASTLAPKMQVIKMPILRSCYHEPRTSR